MSSASLTVQRKNLSQWFRSSGKDLKADEIENTTTGSVSSQTSASDAGVQLVEKAPNETLANYHNVLSTEEKTRTSPLPHAESQVTAMGRIVKAALDETARGYQWTVAASEAQKQLSESLKAPLVQEPGRDRSVSNSDVSAGESGTAPVRYVSVPRNAQDPAALLAQQHHILYDTLANSVPDTEKATDLHTAAVTEIQERWALTQKLLQDLRDDENEIQRCWAAYSNLAKDATCMKTGSSASVGNLWVAEREYRKAIQHQELIESKLNTVLQQMAASETKRSERLRRLLQEGILKQQAKAFQHLGVAHKSAVDSLRSNGNENPPSKKDRIHQVADSLGATAVFSKSNKTSKKDGVVFNEDIVLDPSSPEYSKFLKELLFNGSLLSSHYVHFAEVAKVEAEGSDDSPSAGDATVLVVVTCDRVLHVFDLIGVDLGTDAETSFRFVLNQAESDAADRCAESASADTDCFIKPGSLDWSSYKIAPAASIELSSITIAPLRGEGVELKARDPEAWTKHRRLVFKTHDKEEDFMKACSDGKSEATIAFI